jgi:hypothetical protein
LADLLLDVLHGSGAPILPAKGAGYLVPDRSLVLRPDLHALCVHRVSTALLAVNEGAVLGQDLALVVAQVLLTDGTHVPRFDGLGLHPVLARVGAPRPLALACGHLEAPAQDLVDFMVEQRALPQERVLGRDAEDLEQHK